MKQLEDPAQKLYKEKNKNLDLDRQVEPFAMWAFWTSLIYLWFGFSLGQFSVILFFIPIVTFILAIVSLVRLSDSKKYRGKGYAIASLILSIIEIIIVIVLLYVIWNNVI